MQTFREANKKKKKFKSPRKFEVKVGEYDMTFSNPSATLKPTKIPSIMMMNDDVSVATSPSKADLIDISIKERSYGPSSPEKLPLNSERQTRFNNAQSDEKHKLHSVKTTRAAGPLSIDPPSNTVMSGMKKKDRKKS